ncbi:hypothetical protein B0H17DRAFT_1193813 [Mycena rosella]|uniref:Uncharacterized protein n=1 Tax=Mycena rosella TaxID=1033263 RepID=A0AAD7GT00_MYCRO|nr:hypothetical protein B0H17DRAFT_1193813 [Mycena rosella]
MSPAQLAFSPCHPPSLPDSHSHSRSHLLTDSHARRSLDSEALASFIAKQKALLARTQSDLNALCRFRDEAVADAAGLAAQLGDSAFRLSLQADCAPAPPDIDWALFAHKDPTPPPPPPPRPRPPRPRPRAPAPAPSALQQLVRAARARILDPVLAVYGEPDDPPAAPEHTKTLHATANGDGKDECAPRMPPRGPSGLFTRRPRVRVDAYPHPSADPYAEGSTTASTRMRTASPCRSLEMAMQREAAMEPEREMEEVPMALAKPVRARRISTKLQHQSSDRGAPLVIRARRKSVAAATMNASARTSTRAQEREVPALTPVATPAAATAAAPAPKQQTLKLILPARSAPAHALPAPAAVAPSRPALSRSVPATASFFAPSPAPDPNDPNDDAPRTVLGKRHAA